MKIRMELLSDTIFGNGMSVPGGEDVSVLCDGNGFPYYKGGTFKGVFREEMERLLGWKQMDQKETQQLLGRLLGAGGEDETARTDKLMFSDFTLSEEVKERILEEIGSGNADTVKNSLTHIRTFTAVTEDGTAKEGSLRSARCVNRGLSFYSTIHAESADEALVEEVLSCVKWIGSMRNRGFGKIRLTVESR